MDEGTKQSNDAVNLKFQNDTERALWLDTFNSAIAQKYIPSIAVREADGVVAAFRARSQ